MYLKIAFVKITEMLPSTVNVERDTEFNGVSVRIREVQPPQ